MCFQLLKGKGQARLDTLKGSVVVGGTNFRKMQDPNANEELFCGSNVFVFCQTPKFFVFVGQRACADASPQHVLRAHSKPRMTAALYACGACYGNTEYNFLSKRRVPSYSNMAKDNVNKI
jgi:hypothetical protein